MKNRRLIGYYADLTKSTSILLGIGCRRLVAKSSGLFLASNRREKQDDYATSN